MLDFKIQVRSEKKFTYDYTIAGQLASLTTRNVLTTGNSEPRTDFKESFLWDGLALIRRGGVNYLNEPHAGGGAALLAGGHQKSAKPKPVAWGDRDFEAVRRHGARSGRPRRSGNVMFNDMLGTTLGTTDKQDTFAGNRSTAFGEGDTDALFTGKPYVEGLGHAFLLRNYRADLGKWQTADPLGHPDGWNNFAYCNGRVTSELDLFGAWSLQCTDSYNEGVKYTGIVETSTVIPFVSYHEYRLAYQFIANPTTTAETSSLTVESYFTVGLQARTGYNITGTVTDWEFIATAGVHLSTTYSVDDQGFVDVHTTQLNTGNIQTAIYTSIAAALAQTVATSFPDADKEGSFAHLFAASGAYTRSAIISGISFNGLSISFGNLGSNSCVISDAAALNIHKIE